MQTGKQTFGTNTQFTTFVVELGSHKGISIFSNYSLSHSFIFDKFLQLIITPIANPIIHNLPSLLLSNPFEVFHNNLVSVKIGNNLLTDVVIDPSHKPFFTTAKFLQKSLRTSCAFGLKFTTQELEFPFNLLNFRGFEELTIRSDSKIIYSEINAKNFMISRAFDINFFGKSKEEEASSFFVYPQQTLTNFPTEIFFITIGNNEWNLDSAFDCSNAQDIVLERSTSWKVISYRTSVYNGFALCLLDNPTGLFDTSNSELGLKTFFHKLVIDKGMKLDIIFDFELPSLINTELQSFFIDSNSFDYFRSCINSDFGCCSTNHLDNKERLVYKAYGQMSSEQRGIGIPHTLESVCILPNLL